MATCWAAQAQLSTCLRASCSTAKQARQQHQLPQGSRSAGLAGLRQCRQQGLRRARPGGWGRCRSEGLATCADLCWQPKARSYSRRGCRRQQQLQRLRSRSWGAAAQRCRGMASWERAAQGSRRGMRTSSSRARHCLCSAPRLRLGTAAAKQVRAKRWTAFKTLGTKKHLYVSCQQLATGRHVCGG